jgi:hypothetical protein
MHISNRGSKGKQLEYKTFSAFILQAEIYDKSYDSSQ